ncbi:hypothetical protein FZ103_15865 [Streptomonospora sp. PA3]|uniref:type IV toxin-antitoxin system AbiEi family antitoxin domain-containing protein n=1 Tax=Streptomonospora sp. PA3 TaxID=2607326 RepID=UPI0013077998|nr:hypothetical protein [Streptomonospora sp. PA3]
MQQRGLITLAQARRCGVGDSALRRLLRRGEWRRVFGGVYAVAELQRRGTERDRVATAALAAQLGLGPAAVVGAETAARLWGLQGLRPWDGRAVHVVMPANTRQGPGVVLHRWALGRDDVATVDGIRVTAPGRTLRDTLLDVDRDTGVCLLDSALCRGLVRHGELGRLEAANRGRRGCRRVRGWQALADGRAQSPLETRVRLVCTDGGFAPTQLQRPFHDERGRLIAVADFWWADRLLIGEADGIGPHSTPGALAGDRRRQNALQNRYPGVRIARFTWSDLDRPGYILATIADAGRC